MSDLSEELEGDVEDFEEDGDLSEWAVFESTDEFHSSNTKKSASSYVRNSSEKNESHVPSGTKEISTGTAIQKSPKSSVDEGGVTYEGSANEHSTGKGNAPKNRSGGKSEYSKGNMGARTSSGSVDDNESKKKIRELETQDSEMISEMASDKTKKRKLISDDNLSSSKALKINNEAESDILMVIDGCSHAGDLQEEVEDKDEEAKLKSAGAKKNLQEEVHIFTEEEFKTLDHWLVDGMFDTVKEELTSEMGGDKFTIRFSPVELADLAESSVQDLIKSQPNLAFYLKRQGKFKKKKGYAEVYLSQLQEVRVFISKLLQVKLVEHYAEIIITFSQFKREPKFLSFTIWFNKRNKLLKLLESSEDPSQAKPGVPKEKIVIDSVPASATPQLLRLMFPYATSVLWAPEKKALGTGFQGPAEIIYTSEKCLEAVLECCTDFSFNGCALDIQHSQSVKDTKQKLAFEQEIDGVAAKETQSSAYNLDANEEAGKEEISQDSNNSSTQQEPDPDDDISSMTLDVCAGMMESLNKLRQLGTANPEVLKILEMQSQLTKLQESLSKGSGTSSANADTDPWTVSSSDTQNVSSENQELVDSNTQNKKLTKRKLEEERRNEKQRKEMEDLQRMIEKADEAEREREERAKQQIALEMHKVKEMEENRKSSWARKMIEDVKLQGNSARDVSPATRQEAQRILKTYETKQKENAESLAKQEKDTIEGSETAVISADKKILSSDSHKTHAAAQSTSATGSKSRKVSLATVLARQKDALMQQKTDEKKEKSLNAEEKGDVSEKKQTEETIEVTVSQPGIDVKADALDRSHCEDVPVYTDQEYQELCDSDKVNTLPAEYYIQVTYFPNRRCPVPKCPATTYFKTEASFIDHWEIFHKPNVTMRFCPKCTAYFMNITELQNHLSHLHSVTDVQTVKKMSGEARVKVVNNPSYRDAGRYLPPVVKLS